MTVTNLTDSLNNESEDVIDVHDDVSNHLEDAETISNHKIELVPGEKDGSEWMILDDIFNLHKKDKSANETFWECSGRRRLNCQFKCATFEGEDGMELKFMYKLEKRYFNQIQKHM